MVENTKIRNEEGELIKAGCVLINDKREVLLVSFKGEVWSFPKGHAERGETLEQIAIREVKEETGYTIDIIKRLSDVTYTHENGDRIRVALFEAKPVGEPVTAEQETISKWSSIQKAREIIAPNLAFILNEIQIS